MLNKKIIVQAFSISLCFLLAGGFGLVANAQDSALFGKTYIDALSEESQSDRHYDKNGNLSKQILVIESRNETDIDRGTSFFIRKKAVKNNTEKFTDLSNPIFKSIITVNKGMSITPKDSISKTASGSISGLVSTGTKEISTLLGFSVTESISITKNIAESFEQSDVPYRGHFEIYPIYESYDYVVYMKPRRGADKIWTPIESGSGRRAVGFEAKFVRDTF